MFVFFTGMFFLIPFLAQASSHSLSLSVTPTLFQMSASPLQEWESSVKVINNNRYPITVYANVVNFAPQGETGQGKFLPIFEKFSEGKTLAEWIDVTDEPIVVSGETSVNIPFLVTVPEDASPGGHFAAIMIGTKPPDSGEKLQVKTSQVVTSLFFVRIAGDVVEDGDIREFRTTDAFVDVPTVNFSLRFENKGNVHLQPQGEILITNMWGKERGVIPINQKTQFGNVLPDSIRNFEFTWKGESRFSDIGRYKAEVTLAYGSQDRRFVTRTAYFWVVPVKAVVSVLGSIVLFIWFISWAIKAYIRRMLALSGVEYSPQRRPIAREGDVLIQKRTSLQSPVRIGMKDLKEHLRAAHAFFDVIKGLMLFIWAYRIFFASLITFIFAVIIAWYFITEVTTEKRNYEVVIENADADITLSSEDIIYDKENNSAFDPIQPEEVATSEASNTTGYEQPFFLTLINSSDTPGAAASLQKKLEDKFTVYDLQSDFGEPKDRTVIVYDVTFQDYALQLSKELNGALLSAAPTDEQDGSITIFIGNDYIFE